MGRVVVIGGGAAGLMAAYAAGSQGAQVTLLERNEKLGKKIYITGKGRCNLTNDCPPDEFLENVVRGGKFLTGALWSFSPEDMMSLCERFSLPVKVERGNRVFPVSDHASDVTKMLERACLSVGVTIKLQEYVKEIGVLHSTMRDIITFLIPRRAPRATGCVSQRAWGTRSPRACRPSSGSTAKEIFRRFRASL